MTWKVSQILQRNLWCYSQCACQIWERWQSAVNWTNYFLCNTLWKNVMTPCEMLISTKKISTYWISATLFVEGVDTIYFIEKNLRKRLKSCGADAEFSEFVRRHPSQLARVWICKKKKEKMQKSLLSLKYCSGRFFLKHASSSAFTEQYTEQSFCALLLCKNFSIHSQKCRIVSKISTSSICRICFCRRGWKNSAEGSETVLMALPYYCQLIL